MLDTMTLTKVVASICGAFLILLLGKWAAEGLYHVGGHGDEQAYAIEVEESGGEAAEEVAAVPFPVIYAAASAEEGEGLWRPCAACHKLEDGANGVGPHLYGLVGRDKGSVDGYAYSEILATMDGDWTPENLDGFLANPKDYAPGTKMSYAGMKDAEDRANLIAYLNTYAGNAAPADFVDAAAAATEAPSEEAAAEEAPAEEAATEEAATEEAATEEAATEEAATEEVATEEAATEEAATEEAATEEAATEEAATEEAATEEAATEEAATEEAATEEAATEEAATEEAATEEAATEEAATEEAASGFDAVFAAADASAGEKLFRQCASCHKIEDGARGAGPHLYGVVGRDIASVEGFRYSDALLGLEGAWTPAELSAYLENPKDYAPGNRMSYRGMADETDRANLIAYIEQESN